MSVSVYPSEEEGLLQIDKAVDPAIDEERLRETRFEQGGEEKYAPRTRLLIILLSSLILWSGIILLALWIF